MIARKLWRYFFLAIVLVQFARARPASDADVNSINYDQLESAGSAGSQSASRQLLQFTLNAWQNVAQDAIERAKTISENILKHSDILSNESPKILEFQKNLTQFVEKYSSCADLEDLFELVETFSYTTESYLESEADSLDASEKLIADLLRKYGMPDIELKVWNDLKEFVQKFINKFEDLRENLNREEGEMGQKLLEWFESFKTLSNNDAQKIIAFVDFLLLFPDEEEFWQLKFFE